MSGKTNREIIAEFKVAENPVTRDSLKAMAISRLERAEAAVDRLSKALREVGVAPHVIEELAKR